MITLVKEDFELFENVEKTRFPIVNNDPMVLRPLPPVRPDSSLHHKLYFQLDSQLLSEGIKLDIYNFNHQKILAENLYSLQPERWFDLKFSQEQAFELMSIREIQLKNDFSDQQLINRIIHSSFNVATTAMGLISPLTAIVSAAASPWILPQAPEQQGLGIEYAKGLIKLGIEKNPNNFIKTSEYQFTEKAQNYLYTNVLAGISKKSSGAGANLYINANKDSAKNKEILKSIAILAEQNGFKLDLNNAIGLFTAGKILEIYEIAEQQRAAQSLKAQFDGLHDTAGFFTSLGALTNNKDLQKFGVFSQAAVSIAYNAALLSGGTALGSVSGLAALSPISAIGMACITLIGLFSQQKDNGLGKSLQAIMEQIQALHKEMRQHFKIVNLKLDKLLETQEFIISFLHRLSLNIRGDLRALQIDIDIILTILAQYGNAIFLRDLKKYIDFISLNSDNAESLEKMFLHACMEFETFLLTQSADPALTYAKGDDVTNDQLSNDEYIIRLFPRRSAYSLIGFLADYLKDKGYIFPNNFKVAHPDVWSIAARAYATLVTTYPQNHFSKSISQDKVEQLVKPINNTISFYQTLSNKGLLTNLLNDYKQDLNNIYMFIKSCFNYDNSVLGSNGTVNFNILNDDFKSLLDKQYEDGISSNFEAIQVHVNDVFKEIPNFPHIGNKVNVQAILNQLVTRKHIPAEFILVNKLTTWGQLRSALTHGDGHLRLRIFWWAHGPIHEIVNVRLNHDHTFSDSDVVKSYALGDEIYFLPHLHYSLQFRIQFEPMEIVARNLLNKVVPAGYPFDTVSDVFKGHYHNVHAEFKKLTDRANAKRLILNKIFELFDSPSNDKIFQVPDEVQNILNNLEKLTHTANLIDGDTLRISNRLAQNHNIDDLYAAINKQNHALVSLKNNVLTEYFNQLCTLIASEGYKVLSNPVDDLIQIRDTVLMIPKYVKNNKALNDYENLNKFNDIEEKIRSFIIEHQYNTAAEKITAQHVSLAQLSYDLSHLVFTHTDSIADTNLTNIQQIKTEQNKFIQQRTKIDSLITNLSAADPNLNTNTIEPEKEEVGANQYLKQQLYTGEDLLKQLCGGSIVKLEEIERELHRLEQAEQLDEALNSGPMTERPLHLALQMENVELVSLLLKHDAKVESETKNYVKAISNSGIASEINALLDFYAYMQAQNLGENVPIGRILGMLDPAVQYLAQPEHQNLENAVIFLGSTGEGKGSLINSLLGVKYQKKGTAWRSYLEAVGEMPELAHTSRSMHSDTVYPQFFKLGSNYLVDMPGFGATQGLAANIVTGLTTQMLAHNFNSVRTLVLVLSAQKFAKNKLTPEVSEPFDMLGRIIDQKPSLLANVILVVNRIGEESLDQQIKEIINWFKEAIKIPTLPKTTQFIFQYFINNSSSIQLMDAPTDISRKNILAEIDSKKSQDFSLFNFMCFHPKAEMFKTLVAKINDYQVEQHHVIQTIIHSMVKHLLESLDKTESDHEALKQELLNLKVVPGYERQKIELIQVFEELNLFESYMVESLKTLNNDLELHYLNSSTVAMYPAATMNNLLTHQARLQVAQDSFNHIRPLTDYLEHNTHQQNKPLNQESAFEISELNEDEDIAEFTGQNDVNHHNYRAAEPIGHDNRNEAENKLNSNKRRIFEKQLNAGFPHQSMDYPVSNDSLEDKMVMLGKTGIGKEAFAKYPQALDAETSFCDMALDGETIHQENENYQLPKTADANKKSNLFSIFRQAADYLFTLLPQGENKQAVTQDTNNSNKLPEPTATAELVTSSTALVESNTHSEQPHKNIQEPVCVLPKTNVGEDAKLMCVGQDYIVHVYAKQTTGAVIENNQGENSYLKPGDYYDLSFCKPIDYNNQPSVTCPGKTTSIVYTPFIKPSTFDFVHGSIPLYGEIVAKIYKLLTEKSQNLDANKPKDFIYTGELLKQKLAQAANELSFIKTRVDKLVASNPKLYQQLRYDMSFPLEQYAEELKALNKIKSLEKSKWLELLKDIKHTKDYVFNYPKPKQPISPVVSSLIEATKKPKRKAKKQHPASCVDTYKNLEIILTNVSKNEDKVLRTSPQLSEQLQFSWHEVKGDGDCGYTAFGIKREVAHQLLNVNLNLIRDIIKPALNESLLTEAFIEFLQKKNLLGQALSQAFYNYKHISRNGGEVTQEVLDTLLRAGDDLVVTQAYLDYDVKEKQIDKGWSHPVVLFALAEIQNIAIHLWQYDDAGQLIPHAYYPDYIPTHAQQRTDLLFVNNNHFERLTLIERAELNNKSTISKDSSYLDDNDSCMPLEKQSGAKKMSNQNVETYRNVQSVSGNRNTYFYPHPITQPKFSAEQITEIEHHCQQQNQLLLKK